MEPRSGRRPRSGVDVGVMVGTGVVVGGDDCDAEAVGVPVGQHEKWAGSLHVERRKTPEVQQAQQTEALAGQRLQLYCATTTESQASNRVGARICQHAKTC